MTNEGMVNDYHLASRRSKQAAAIAYSCTGGLLLNVILWWPFDGLELFIAATLFILAVAFGITGWDYKRKAEAIEAAWEQAYNRPG